MTLSEIIAAIVRDVCELQPADDGHDTLRVRVSDLRTIVESRLEAQQSSLAAAQARLEELEAQQMWQPIETAPKDRTAILLCNRAGSFIGYYMPVYQSGYRPKGPWSSLLLNHEHMPRDGAHEQPTHWMPLPQPPTEKSNG